MPRIPRVARSRQDAASNGEPASAGESQVTSGDLTSPQGEETDASVQSSATAPEPPNAGASSADQPAPAQPASDADANAAPGAGTGSDEAPAAVAEGQGGFVQRGQMRRRLRFLRRARELALRDLGGLVFDMHRFGRTREDLVAGKVGTLTRIDTELRALELALDDVQAVTVLREAGITACPRCAAIHATDARFCPNCGLPLGRHAQLPVAPSMAPAPAGAGAPGGETPEPPPLGAQAAAAGAPPAAEGAPAAAASGPESPATPASPSADPAEQLASATPAPTPASAPDQASSTRPDETTNGHDSAEAPTRAFERARADGGDPDEPAT